MNGNTSFQYYQTTLELSQSLLRGRATICHVEVAANLRNHTEIRLLPSKKFGCRFWL